MLADIGTIFVSMAPRLCGKNVRTTSKNTAKYIRLRYEAFPHINTPNAPLA